MNEPSKQFTTRLFSFPFILTAEVSPRIFPITETRPIQSTKLEVPFQIRSNLSYWIKAMAWCGQCIELWLPWAQFSFKRVNPITVAVQDWFSWRVQGRRMIQHAANHLFFILFMHGLLTDNWKGARTLAIYQLLVVQILAILARLDTAKMDGIMLHWCI